jgi:hypothetical protein
MKPLDIESIRARAEKATPGPWITDHNDTFVSAHNGDGDWDWIVGDMTLDSGQEQSDFRGYNIKANCIFIAHARQDIPALCDRVEALEVRIRELEAKMGERPIFDDADILVIERTASRHPEDGWAKCWKRIRPLIDWATKGNGQV